MFSNPTTAFSRGPLCASLSIQKMIKIITKNKINFFIAIAIIGLIMVSIFDYLDIQFSVHDILVEFHGLIFDLFIFGIILTIYESITAKREQIDRYKEEIEDYRFWKSEESMYRTRGLIKRLVDLNEKEIDLSFCYLETDKSLSRYRNMNGWIFSGAFLRGNMFMLADLSNTHFYGTDLTDATFQQITFKDSVFRSSSLIRTQFEKCQFDNTDFKGAYVSDINWFDNLMKEGNIGVDNLISQYKLSPTNVDGTMVYEIQRK